ncbi:MAG: LuxR C-terminal-related transcriptional regulator [Salinimicrobium sp.]
MEKKQLLLITKNPEFLEGIENDTSGSYEVTIVKSVHAAYPMALSYLPDIILIDFSSLGLKSLKNLENFKSSHFLNKSYLFLFGDKENKKILGRNFKEQVDGILYDHHCFPSVLREIEEVINTKKCLTNYWKDSFMGLFNLLGSPVVLLQDEKIVAMNDAFKKDFFITGKKQLRLTDFVVSKNKNKVRETLKKFIRGKHMKASTTTVLLMNEKLREARVTFSKLDKSLSGQMVMMINFTGNELPIDEQVGSTSADIDRCFKNDDEAVEKPFTKREQEVISLLCKGYKTKEISQALCISSKTIEKHRANIIRRTHSGTILESVVYALNNNLIEI